MRERVTYREARHLKTNERPLTRDLRWVTDDTGCSEYNARFEGEGNYLYSEFDRSLYHEKRNWETVRALKCTFAQHLLSLLHISGTIP